jgi:hypothetical protein
MVHQNLRTPSCFWSLKGDKGKEIPSLLEKEATKKVLVQFQIPHQNSTNWNHNQRAVSSSIYATLAVNTANSRKESTERAVLNTVYIFLDASDCSQATTVLLLPENFITSYQPMMSQGAAGIFWGMKALQYLYVRTWPGNVRDALKDIDNSRGETRYSMSVLTSSWVNSSSVPLFFKPQVGQ